MAFEVHGGASRGPVLLIDGGGEGLPCAHSNGPPRFDTTSTIGRLTAPGQILPRCRLTSFHAFPAAQSHADPGGRENLLPEKLCARLVLSRNDLVSFSVIRKAIDARHKGRIKFVYTVRFELVHEDDWRKAHCNDPDLDFIEEREQPAFSRLATDKKIYVAGMGPAGLFAALRLSAHGLVRH